MWDKKCLSWVFWGQNYKKLLSYLKSTPSNLSEMSLSDRINFGIGSAFSKGLGSAFSEGPCPGPCPLYKVCQSKVIQLYMN